MKILNCLSYSAILLIAAAFMNSACGPNSMNATDDSATDQPNKNTGGGAGSPEADPQELKNIVLDSDMNLRTLSNVVLEFAATLPKGSEISISTNVQPVNYQFRREDGSLAFSSSGFYPGIRILKSTLPVNEISRLNNLPTGLYISAMISGDLISGPTYPIVVAGAPGEGFKKNFELSGKPKVSFTKYVKERFPNTLNKAIPMSSLPGAEQTKWTRIMQELQKTADRTKISEKGLLIIERALADRYSIDFENNGTVQKSGAWSIAISTAVRNNFAKTPCAEFMSEVLRQAYSRAGYSHYEDFNKSKKNALTYFDGAALVLNFSAYLDKAGWIPWDAQFYIPPVGAFMMNGSGKSPGHTYMSAGDNGRLIIDNGMPQGRDLRITPQDILEMMYQDGVFFLPPGFIPQKW